MDATRILLLAATVWLATAHLPASEAIGQTIARTEIDNGQNDLVRAELVANVLSVMPGQPFRLAVRLRIADTWDVNWINPGDAGLAPSIAWKLPDGFKAGPIEWPYPKRFNVGPLTIFGYDRELLLVTQVTVPAGLETGTSVVLSASVDWLACQEACVPGEATLSLRLPVYELADINPEHYRAFIDAESRVPAAAEHWILSATYGSDQIVIDLQPVEPTAHLPYGVFFFPTDQGVIENSEAQELRPAGGGFQLLVTRSRSVGDLPPRLSGVLVSETGWDVVGTHHALQVDVPLEPR